uniref:ATP synthase complex subunit 8 n=1 Tax=Wiedomys cerradensis TaxID=1353928 RepID=A0A0A0QMA1_9RODE|nr:ATP synthase F0 subunit 8 [Wiedomys cerradensis]AIR76238.1 ATP synthase F0 subunit 8 [Wiedomys cerradensis]
MPQLDTSTWLITAISTSITLFMIMQLKICSQNFSIAPATKNISLIKASNPWEQAWTKIYLPLSLPQQ